MSHPRSWVRPIESLLRQNAPDFKSWQVCVERMAFVEFWTPTLLASVAEPNGSSRGWARNGLSVQIVPFGKVDGVQHVLRRQSPDSWSA